MIDFAQQAAHAKTVLGGNICAQFSPECGCICIQTEGHEPDVNLCQMHGNRLPCGKIVAGSSITTIKESRALPAATVVRSAGGTIAAKRRDGWGVVFGMAAEFPWDKLELPLLVLWIES